MLRYALPLSAFVVADVLAYDWYTERKKNERIPVSSAEQRAAMQWKPPSREELMNRLAKHSNRDRELDVLIIGGGATGTGCAVDCAVRGLKVSCVEREDWSSGTSSKSTKLVHGGVRYLEKAVLNMDIQQYNLVEEALRERATVLKIAPHLTSQMPIMLPIYQWYTIPYFWAGSKAYDLVAGGSGLHNSYFLSRQEALEIFPLLKSEGLSGAMVYYDGMQNDSRVNVSLALTSIFHGAIATNYTKVVNLLKDEETGRLIGARLQDMLTGHQFTVYAKCIINATGPYCDLIRRMDDQQAPQLVQPSAGAHIILPKYICPKNMGLIDPSTSDGRVLFLLPWEGAVISGTTDVSSEITFSPKATGEEIDFIVDEIAGYLSPDVQVTRNQVQAAWSGLRPLVRDLSSSSDNAKTESLVRSHLISTSTSGLVTIAGGKWTTYRNMAKETVDHVCGTFHFQPQNPNADTSKCLLIGAHGYLDTLYVKLIQEQGLEEDIALHLAQNYGDRAATVADMKYPMPVGVNTAEMSKEHKRLHPNFPYLEAEIRYACRNEYAESIIDVIGRRMRLAFVNVRAAQEVLPQVARIMAEEKHWSSQEKQMQIRLAEEYLKTMGSEELTRDGKR
jgi:glycerol-3-phosphate dehydrogenase